MARRFYGVDCLIVSVIFKNYKVSIINFRDLYYNTGLIISSLNYSEGAKNMFFFSSVNINAHN